MNVLRCLAVLAWLNSVATVFGDCPMGYFNSSDNILCCLCPPGYFMRKACDSLTETVCRRCPANTDISTPNNFSRDRCECPSDTYWDSKFLRCAKCTHCARGQRRISPCEKTNDAKCETCRKGTYVDSLKNICEVCDYCKKGETVVQQCQSWQNTVCRNKNREEQEQTTTVLPQTKPITAKTTTMQWQGDQTSVIPVEADREAEVDAIIWVMGAIIFALFVMLLVTCTCLCLLKKGRVWTRTRRKDNAPRKKGTGTRAVSKVIKENNVKFSTTPAHITEQLGLYLNPSHGHNWKILAGRMGYTSVHTQNWELTNTEMTQKLLQDWSQRQDATVYALYEYLKQLGRDDAAQVLLPFLTEQKSQGESV